MLEKDKVKKTPTMSDHVKNLIAQAANSLDSADAQRFSQAANNAANAMCSLNHTETNKFIAS